MNRSGTLCLLQRGVNQTASDLQPGGNMEGKEMRFGVANSALFASITTTTSCGAVNSMHDSFSPLGGLVPMVLMQLGEVVFGGVGSGLYGMLAFAMVAVFVSGLMVGRTPEYLGKKIEAFEMKMVALVILVPASCVLLGTAIIIRDGCRSGGYFEPRAAWVFADTLCVFLSLEQQWQRLCRPFGKHSVL